MKREWKPGDVALVRFRLGHPYFRCIRGLSNDCWWDDEGVCVGDREVLSVHPLVVLDPEDREQQDGLRDLIRNFGGGMIPGEILQRALRSLVAAPRTEEPTDVGAMVTASYRDADGKGFGPATWARSGDGTWVCLTDGMVGRVVPWPFLCDVEVQP